MLLITIPGISELSACVILAEIGRDMSRFPRRTPDLLGRPVPEERRECRQAALYPDAQKPALAKAGGAPWLKTTLVQCAWAAARKKASYLQAQFHRLRVRRGAKKAIGAARRLILHHRLPHAD